MLSADQRRAIELLATGSTQGETAEEIGYSRQRVNAWVRNDPEFQAELEATIKASTKEARQYMRGRIAKVLSRVSALIESEDEAIALRAALAWLDRAGITEVEVSEAGTPIAGDISAALEFVKWKQAKEQAAQPRSEGNGDSSCTSD